MIYVDIVNCGPWVKLHDSLGIWLAAGHSWLALRIPRILGLG